MGKVKKSSVSKYAKMWEKSKGAIEKKKEWKQYKDGKCQARIESSFWDKTKTGNDCIKFELKILTGDNTGRTIKRTFFIENEADEETQINMDRFKGEMKKLGISDLKTPDEAMDSLEECIIEISVWINPKKPENYPIPFFNKYIKGPEDEDKQSTETVTVITSDDSDDIEY